MRRNGNRGNPNHWPKGDPCGRGGQFAPSGQSLGDIEGKPNYNKEIVDYIDEHQFLKMFNGREENDKKREKILSERFENSKEMASAISNWLYEDGRDKELLDEYIDNSPAYDGVTYRGLQFDEKEKYEPFSKLTTGDKLRMFGNASWTTDRNKAEMFGAVNFGEEFEIYSVLLICDKNKTSTSIKHLSEFGENEVLSHSKSEWEVIEVIRFREKPEGLIIRVEEVEVA